MPYITHNSVAMLYPFSGIISRYEQFCHLISGANTIKT